MRKPIYRDDVEELEFGARTPDEHRRAAEVLAGWAAEPHPDDEDVTPALLLIKAGEQLDFAEDTDGALEMYRRAQTAGGDVLPDVRCYLHHGLMEVGDVAGAREVAEGVRRSKPRDPDAYRFIAEDYDLAGDLAEANRWMNLGLRRLIADAEDGELKGFLTISFLIARRRVRRALGFPPDEFDRHPDLPPPIDLPE